MAERLRYLKQIWRPYPASPPGTVSVGSAVEGAWFGGEIVAAGAGELTLQAQGRLKTFAFTHGELAPEGPLEILRPGDKVAVQLRADWLTVCLLAPCVKDSSQVVLSPQTAEIWQRFIQVIRAFWINRGFIEISTPSLVTCPGFEPTIEPVRVGNQFLPTSPEISLKKVLAAGFSEIFEIRSCFRAGELSAHHQPEFTMLEWYRSYAGVESLITDLIALLSQLATENLTINEIGECERYSVAEIFKKTLAFELKPDTSRSELEKLGRFLEIYFVASDTWNDIFHRIWIEKIDPWLAARPGPVFVDKFPSSQAALARIGDDGWAERVELYWRGLEIANGFHELNDPIEQSRRAKADLQARVDAGRSPVAMDEDFILALERGMAPAAGMALGLERLLMAAQGIQDIRQLKALPYFPNGPGELTAP